jgi:hypothetical protein
LEFSFKSRESVFLPFLVLFQRVVPYWLT